MQFSKINSLKIIESNFLANSLDKGDFLIILKKK